MQPISLTNGLNQEHFYSTTVAMLFGHTSP